MSYISHEDYKNLMSKFQKETSKGKLLNEDYDYTRRSYDDEGESHSLDIEHDLHNLFDIGKINQKQLDAALDYVADHDYELYSDNLGVKYVLKQVAAQMKEGNAFTAGLAKTKKGGEFKVGDKTFKDKSNYDASMEEASYTDNYPDSWGYREDKEMEEGLHMPPLQATGDTISTVKEENSFGRFSVLSPGEREQIQQYAESIKTIKEEMNKILAKAGTKVKTEDMGGDRTNLTMTSSTVSEASQKIEKIESKIPEKLYSAAERVIEELKKAGLNDGEIKMFLNHEIEEKAKEAVNAQHDH